MVHLREDKLYLIVLTVNEKYYMINFTDDKIGSHCISGPSPTHWGRKCLQGMVLKNIAGNTVFIIRDRQSNLYLRDFNEKDSVEYFQTDLWSNNYSIERKEPQALLELQNDSMNSLFKDTDHEGQCSKFVFSYLNQQYKPMFCVCTQSSDIRI